MGYEWDITNLNMIYNMDMDLVSIWAWIKTSDDDHVLGINIRLLQLVVVQSPISILLFRFMFLSVMLVNIWLTYINHILNIY